MGNFIEKRRVAKTTRYVKYKRRNSADDLKGKEGMFFSKPESPQLAGYQCPYYDSTTSPQFSSQSSFEESPEQENKT